MVRKFKFKHSNLWPFYLMAGMGFIPTVSVLGTIGQDSFYTYVLLGGLACIITGISFIFYFKEQFVKISSEGINTNKKAIQWQMIESVKDKEKELVIRLKEGEDLVISKDMENFDDIALLIETYVNIVKPATPLVIIGIPRVSSVLTQVREKAPCQVDWYDPKRKGVPKAVLIAYDCRGPFYDPNLSPSEIVEFSEPFFEVIREHLDELKESEVPLLCGIISDELMNFSDDELFELTDMELRELLDTAGYPGDETPVISLEAIGELSDIIQHSNVSLKDTAANEESNLLEADALPIFYFEKDNAGTRIRNWDHYQGMIMADMQKAADPPGVTVFTFSHPQKAHQAILELSYIHRALDSEKLISTAIIDFGVVDSGDGEWAAIVHGQGLTKKQQKEAVEVFSRIGGVERANTAPARDMEKIELKSKDGVVNFSHKEDLSKNGGVGEKEIYTATTKNAAIDFLQARDIDKPLFYIEIETPSGWVGKDKDGMYEF